MKITYKNQQRGLSIVMKISGILFALILSLQPSISSATNEKAIESLEFSTLAGSRVQLALTFNDEIASPKIFETDNPARIALDFNGVKSHLAKKSFPVKQGSVNSVYVIEAGGRTRVIVNLTNTVSYQTRQQGKQFILTLAAARSVAVSEKAIKKQQKQDVISKLMPQQGITGLDFRRGPNGEGRLMISLSNPNTVVDIKERGNKVVLNFLNTRLPSQLAKKYDVIDFATPVQNIVAKPRGNGVSIIVKPVNSNFEYSSFQTEGQLTVEFRPLSEVEKLARIKSKFPYIGKKLTLNFQDIEVRSVLQILADFTNLNIIASDSVSGSVTLRLNDVPWDQALALVLKSKGLAKRQSGNVVFVAPAAEITKMEEEELAAKKVIEKLEPLKTEYIPIQYAKAEEIQALLTGQNVVRSSVTSQSQGTTGGFLTPRTTTNTRNQQTTRSQRQSLLSVRGTSTVDSRTNTLIVRDTAKQLEEIHKMIARLDIPVRQVMIESRIVVATTEFARNLGVKFGVAKQASVGSGKNFAVGGGGTQGNINGATTVSNTLVDLAAAGIKHHPVGALGMTLARGADYVLNLELQALENNGKGEVLANPRVMTVDRQKAIIKQGVQIPYQTVSQNGTQTQLIDAVLELNVTPQITPSGEVLMKLKIKKDSPDTSTGGISKREVQTNALVRDGETVVLGGVYEQNEANQIFKIPFFGDLPGVGFLFRKKEVSDNRTELLIFITPKIIKKTLSVN